MDIQMLIMPIVVIGFGLFAGGMFAYRKLTAGETFSWQKFLPTMGIGAIASFGLYLATGALPALDAVFVQIDTLMPGGAPSVSLVIAALLAVWNQISKGATSGGSVVQSTPVESVQQPVGASPGWSPGWTVTPTEQAGVSPFAALLTVVVGNDASSKRCNVRIDWGDGTPKEDFVPDPTSGVVVVSHPYIYKQGTSKYKGRQFYPTFEVIGQDGVSYGTFNVENKACAIEVQSL